MLEAELLPIIFDNTVLSNFALAQSFEILQRLYEGRAFICRAVLQEVQDGINSGWKYPQHRSRIRLQVVNQAMEDGWLQLPSNEVNPSDEVVELQLAIDYSRYFGAGEAEAMAIAYNRSWILATDDRKARRFSQEQGVRLTGSLGVLIKATQENIISLTNSDAIHSRMIDEGYHSPLSYEKGISDHLSSI